MQCGSNDRYRVACVLECSRQVLTGQTSLAVGAVGGKNREIGRTTAGL
jgi:hypothetical protein